MSLLYIIIYSVLPFVFSVRLWRRRVSKLRMLRLERQLASNAALDSLTLGPPVRYCIEVSLIEFCEFSVKCSLLG